VGVSLAWLAVISSAPFVGALAYLLFGERRLGRLRAARIAASIGMVQQWQAHQRHQYDAAAMQIEATAEPIYRHAEHVLGFPILTGNNIELLDNFQAVFDAIVSDIDAAQSRCHVCFYIWHEGGRAAEVVDALVRAARRGVQCRALADSVGSKDFLGGDLARRLRHAGVELSAALRGVEVTLIVPARNDSVLVSYASVAHFDDLMSAGVNIALFKGGLLHTKSLTIDGAISVFGSVNLDMRSLWLNFEISLFVYDMAFTRQLGALQQTYIRNSDRLELDVWRRRPAWRKFTENTFRLLGPLL